MLRMVHRNFNSYEPNSSIWEKIAYIIQESRHAKKRQVLPKGFQKNKEPNYHDRPIKVTCHMPESISYRCRNQIRESIKSTSWGRYTDSSVHMNQIVDFGRKWLNMICKWWLIPKDFQKTPNLISMNTHIKVTSLCPTIHHTGKESHQIYIPICDEQASKLQQYYIS